jgi:hypothetical protein
MYDPVDLRPSCNLRSQPGLTAVACVGLLAAFAGLSWTASETKAPTFDEPLHAAAAWTLTHRGDFRVNPEDPPLWQYWAALPHGADALDVRLDTPLWNQLKGEINRHWWWVTDTLFRSPANDGDTFIRKSRAMMLAVGVALGAMIAFWAWKLGGTIAALAATALYALDPNFIGHSALVKNDVAFSLAMLAAIFAVWRVGQRATWGRIALLALMCGVAVTVKFSGLLVLVMVVALLAVRALGSEPWRILRWDLSTRARRALGAAAITLGVGVASWGAIWAAYQFRYPLSPQGDCFWRDGLKSFALKNQLWAQHPDREPTDDQVAAAGPSLLTRAILFADGKRLLPHGYLMGLLYTHSSTLVRDSYLNGELRNTGWWYYFPLAMLLKTPMAALVAGAGALAVGACVWIRRKRPGVGTGPNVPTTDRSICTTDRNVCPTACAWTAVCLGLSILIYMAAAMRTNLNLGLRHVLPVYPLIYIAVALAAAQAWRSRRALTGALGAAVGLALAVETAAAHPNYIAFFNAACGDAQAAARRLGDSNLDWGQDLLQVARWQQQNPDRTIYLSYFGMADPAFYNIRYVNLPGGYVPARDGEQAPIHWVTQPGVLIVSVTHLQGLYLDPSLRARYRKLMRMAPTALLGSSLWLWDDPAALEIFHAPP